MGLRRGRISEEHAERFIASLGNLQVRLVDPPSYEPVFALADHYKLSVYDAAYLELAIRERLPLASRDKELIRAARQSGIVIFQP